MSLEVGCSVPSFTLISDLGADFCLTDVNSHLVIYFYPKNGTPGCTLEARDFNDRLRQFEDLGVVVVGVSKETVESHRAFKKKNDLNVILLSDPQHKLAAEFGVVVNKSLFGKTYRGVERSTFLINPTGTILKSWHDISARGHAERVLSMAQLLCI